MPRSLALRLPVLAVIFSVAVMGLWAALVRMGWNLPIPAPHLVGMHGGLMVAGMFGTLIALERAVALAGLSTKRFHWAYLAPLMNGLGAVVLLWEGATPLARLLLVVGSVGMLVMFGFMLKRHTADHSLVMALGALFLFGANLAWLLDVPLYQIVHMWIASLVLTIAGERLELSRVRRLGKTERRLFMIAAGLYSIGAVLCLFALDAGVRLAGVGQICLALWLLRYDVATRTVHKQGLPRFVAICLLLGYVWLGIGGGIGSFSGALYGGFLYDALLHAVLVGFVASMVFGHAPIIFPAVLGRPIRFTPLSYGYLFLLHGSLVLREMGNFAQSLEVRQWGGLLNVSAAAIFVLVTLISVLGTSPKTAS